MVDFGFKIQLTLIRVKKFEYLLRALNFYGFINFTFVGLKKKTNKSF